MLLDPVFEYRYSLATWTIQRATENEDTINAPWVCKVVFNVSIGTRIIRNAAAALRAPSVSYRMYVQGLSSQRDKNSLTKGGELAQYRVGLKESADPGVRSSVSKSCHGS